MNKEAVLRCRFASRVREKLEHTGLAPADLAMLCRLPRRRVERILEGSYPPTTLHAAAVKGVRT